MSKYKLKKTFGIEKILAIAAFLLTIAGIGYYAFSKSTDAKIASRATDPATNCRQGSEIPAVRAVVLDRTDPWNEQQKIALKNVVGQITKELAEGQKLLLLPLDGVETATINPQFEKCAPKNPGDASALTENAKILQQKFKEIFGTPLENALNNFSVEKTQKESPIIEALLTISKDQLSPKIAKDRVIYLFSDMMQNSFKYSFFNAPYLNAEKVGLTAETDALRGVLIKVYQLPRCDVAKLQVQSRQFWEAWFLARGAKAEYVTLPGSTESCQNLGAEKKPIPIAPVPAPVTRSSAPLERAVPPPQKPAAGNPPALRRPPVAIQPPQPVAPTPVKSLPAIPAAIAPPTVVIVPSSPSQACSSYKSFLSRNDCMWRRCEREFSGHPECSKYKRDTNAGGAG